ncbi:winged helix-turn-helix domain-containing protein [Streptomyces sp. NPDC004549]|uniref:winged helix-turn-helix domain-containing protein n=1 Tax=Streptomyces sp. NPDC004549 TaxID=3154283 RepID=UPI0033B7C91D
MSLAVACSQPGREWQPADLVEVLVQRPSPAGEWVRSLRTRKGDEYVVQKLAGMLSRAREFVASTPSISSRPDAGLALAEYRTFVEGLPRWGRSFPTDIKNLLARLSVAEQAGGFEHTLSVRQLAELMGSADSTAQLSNKRLQKRGLLRQLDRGSESESATWVLSRPTQPSGEVSSELGTHTAPPTQQMGRVPDSRVLSAIMAHDAFHYFAHGVSGARLLASLEATEGASVAELAQGCGHHPTTVRRRLKALQEDGLVVELEGLYYLDDLEISVHKLAAAAERAATSGRAESRRLRHLQQREGFRRWTLARREAASREWRPSAVVPEEVWAAHQLGGRVLAGWEQWDVSDPMRPVWIDDVG